MFRNQRGDDEEKKLWEYLRGCKLNVDVNIIQKVKENSKREDIRTRIDQSSMVRNKIENPLTIAERGPLIDKIDNMIKQKKYIVICGNLNNNFRIDYPLQKDSFEVQRNGKFGKTTVGQTLLEIEFQKLLNVVAREYSEDIQNLFDKLVLEKLKESIKLSERDLKITVITLEDFIKMIKNYFN
jgi:hypothetical protein